VIALASEDLLRLNVLLVNAQAIRIDEHHMVVYGLGEDRDYEVRLNVTGNEQAYLKKVREFLSTAMFGSPRRYPKYLHRWAGLGQINNVPVDKLLMLGEPDVMLAVAYNSALTDEQAQRAWWAYPGPELGRCLLARVSELDDDFARELVKYLIEYLPFETNTQDILGTVVLVLSSGLADADMCNSMWRRGMRKKVYRIGFMLTDVGKVPEQQEPREDFASFAPVLAAFPDQPLARLVSRIMDSDGQTLIATALDCLSKCSDQDEVNSLLEALQKFFKIALPGPANHETVQAVDAAAALHEKAMAAPLIQELPALHATITGVLVMSQVGPSLTIPYFSKSDASGSVMRKQLAELFDYLQAHLRGLQNGAM